LQSTALPLGHTANLSIKVIIIQNLNSNNNHYYNAYYLIN